jgi:hypothetical protein
MSGSYFAKKSILCLLKIIFSYNLDIVKMYFEILQILSAPLFDFLSAKQRIKNRRVLFQKESFALDYQWFSNEGHS